MRSAGPSDIEALRVALAAAKARAEELEASASEDELAAERAAAKTSTVKAFTRKRPSRKPFPNPVM